MFACSKRLLTIIICIILSISAYSQERFGISNSMYAGISGVRLNPAFIADSPFKWDLNIIGLHTSINNNYVYLNNTNIPIIIADRGKTPIVVNSLANSEDAKKPSFLVKNKDNNLSKNIHIGVVIDGPSFMIGIKRWTFAIESAVRVETSIVGLNKTGAKLAYEGGLSYEPLQNIDFTLPKFRINSMAWTELGFSAAREIKQTKKLVIRGGITVKYLKGIFGAYVLNENADLLIPNNKDIYFKNFKAQYGYAFNKDDAAASNGSGQSMDIGITITRKSRGQDYKCPSFGGFKPAFFYKWRLGISLIDFGFINFKENSFAYNIDNKTDYWENISKMKIKGTSQLDSLISTHFNKSNTPTPTDTKFKMALPWAASVQFDYNFGYNFFLNGTLAQRIPHFGLPGIDRVNTLSVTPHYESSRLGLALPIILYQYTQPTIGLAVRLNNFLIIGTDNLTAIVGHRITGADIYFSIKLNRLRKFKQSRGFGEKH